MNDKRPFIKGFPGETEHILLSGKRVRRPTVLVKIGRRSVSKKALLLGIALVVLQFLDGVLTFIGLSLYGVQMEGNHFLLFLMQSYGVVPALLVIKVGVMGLCAMLLVIAHRRRWVRPMMFIVAVIYVGLAVVPWVYFISRHFAEA